ncbi:uncharacterized protein [Chelonus insularis]|uniref:uncharacterized protein n=1 Tax=Chelonus insularis TaxID=460826 RepID=UPI0015893A52|nr:uncharacterized protein LOC118067345 [Chelonus insularis]
MSLIKILLLLILWKSSDALLIRPINVYQNIIADMHERYKFDALTLLHGHTHYNPYEDIELATKVVKLQIHFARLLIPTAVMSIELFKIQKMPRMNDFQKPFFVFLNDFDDLKNQLTPELLTMMAHPERVSLIFFRDKTKAEKFFENMYIPLNCQFMVSQRNQSDEKNEIITEVYRFSEHDKLKQDFLTLWNPVTGMKLPKMFLHHRRKNFRGHNINVGWVKDWFLRNPLHPNKVENGIGIYIIRALQKETGVSVTSHKIQKMGTCYDNNTCTYAVSKLVSKELDVIGQPVSTFRNFISNNYVDCSMTCFVACNKIYYQKPPNSFKWVTYKELLQHNVWRALGIHMLMTSITIIFIEYKQKVIFLGEKFKNIIPLNVLDICFRVYTMLTNQSVPYSKYNPIQILQFITYVLFIVIYAVYSAKLSKGKLFLSDM